jgi:hypothetical protein
MSEVFAMGMQSWGAQNTYTMHLLSHTGHAIQENVHFYIDTN